MRQRLRPARTEALALATVLLAARTSAQDLEPRRWTHLPVDTNVLAAGYALTKGDIGFDPVLRIDDAEVEAHTTVVSYTRYFALFDTTARLDAHVPFQSTRWEGLLDGSPAGVSRTGMADPVVRFSCNLTGAPPLRGKDFLEYRAKHEVTTAVGAALELRLPLGEYKDDKLLNLGQNRFVVAPQLGVLHTRGDWSFELTGTTFLSTENDEFFSGNTLEQDPLFAVQTHAVRTFANGFWLSAGVAYGFGGETEINGTPKGDDRSNLLYGGSFGFRVGAAQSVRLGYIRGDSLNDVGSNTHSLVVAFAIRF